MAKITVEQHNEKAVFDVAHGQMSETALENAIKRLYDRETNEVSVATTAAIRSTEIFGADNASEIFINYNKSDEYNKIIKDKTGVIDVITLHKKFVNSNFINNSATRGGGIYNNRGYLVIKNSKFYSNSASHLGGGIKSWGYCKIYDSDVRNNRGQYGGGMYISEFTMTVKNTLIVNNTAEEGGGLIADSFGSLIISDSKINSNHANYGGGISADTGNVNAKNCIFTDNVAKYKRSRLCDVLSQKR